MRSCVCSGVIDAADESNKLTLNWQKVLPDKEGEGV